MQPEKAKNTEPRREVMVRFYRCPNCERVVTTPLPRGLRGTFLHAACWHARQKLGYGVLNAEVLV